MSPELKELLDGLRWLAEMQNHPKITLWFEDSPGGKGVLSIDRSVLVELLDLLVATPGHQAGGEG